ncbi:MAG TPA: hypothetical protein VFT22_08180 [Kofleriaceae bacterium]|nr:hypothetical protein [Kofleriaceae bacterium]
MTGLRAVDPATESVTFLVVNAGSFAWGIEAAQVESVRAPGDLEVTVDAARLGVPCDPTASPRVVQLHGAARTGVVVRGQMAIVTVSRAEIQELPAFLTASMTHRTFSSVVLAANQSFLVVDADALRGSW